MKALTKHQITLLGLTITVGGLVCVYYLIEDVNVPGGPLPYDNSSKDRQGEDLRIVPLELRLFGGHNDGLTTNLTTAAPEVDLVNYTWVRERKRLLSDPTRARKMVLFGYMRGGSSIAGETFAHDPGAFYWYEALDQFYSSYLGFPPYTIPSHITYTADGKRRAVGKKESALLTNYVKNLFDCNITALPVETMSHPFMHQSVVTDNITHCLMERNITVNECKYHLPHECRGENQHRRDLLGALRHKCASILHAFRHIPTAVNLTAINDTNKILKHIPFEWRRFLTKHVIWDKNTTEKFMKHEMCMRNVKVNLDECLSESYDNTWCTSKKLQFSKILRANMETMEAFLKEIPDLHIVHYYRDPRAIANSIAQVYAISWNSQNKQDLIPESVILCDKLKRDIDERKRLEKIYPGAFVSATYEDLVTNPRAFADNIYNFMGQTTPSGWLNFTLDAFHKTSINETAFSHTRHNASVTLKKWYKSISYYNMLSTSLICKDLLKELGYSLFPTIQEMVIV